MRCGGEPCALARLRNDAHAIAPAFVDPDQCPFDLGREVAQHRVGGRVDVQCRGYEKQQWILGSKLASGKYPNRWNSPRA